MPLQLEQRVGQCANALFPLAQRGGTHREGDPTTTFGPRYRPRYRKVTISQM